MILQNLHYKEIVFKRYTVIHEHENTFVAVFRKNTVEETRSNKYQN